MAHPWEEASFSEQAINDVDTARLALRWALDRIRILQDEMARTEQTVQDKSSQVAFLDNQLKSRSAEMERILKEREQDLQSEKESLERILQMRIESYKKKEQEEDARRRELEEEYLKRSEEMRTQWARIELDLWKSRQEYLQRQDDFAKQQQEVFAEKERRLREELGNEKALLQREHQARILEVERRHQILQEELKKEEAVFKWAKASWEKEVGTKEKEWNQKEVAIQEKVLVYEGELKTARLQLQGMELKVQEMMELLRKKAEELEASQVRILELGNEKRVLMEKVETIREEEEKKHKDTHQKMVQLETEIPARLRTAQEQGRFEAEKKFEIKEEDLRAQIGRKEEEIGNFENVVKSLEGMVKVLEGEKQNFMEHADQVRRDFERKLERSEEAKRVLEEKVSQRLSTAVENEVRQLQEEFELKKRNFENLNKFREEEIKHLKEVVSSLEEDRQSWLLREQALRKDLRKAQDEAHHKATETESTQRTLLQSERQKFREILRTRDEQIEELRSSLQGSEVKHPPVTLREAGLSQAFKTTPSSSAEQVNKLEKPLTLNLQEVHFAEIMEAVGERVGSRCRSRGIRLDKNCAPGLKSISGDPELLKEALYQIAVNSVEAMSDGGKLSLEVRRDAVQNRIVIQVTDTGKGISREHQDKLFEPFFSTKPGGLGLGLSVAQRIVKAHRGEITIGSESKKGTTVTLTLPE
ncbi:MAG: hypothetical protein HY399_06790 [Elusimicrobia bacterium]|nr:hypothetical protein [Elusimicrobiota bacterium]